MAHAESQVPYRTCTREVRMAERCHEMSATLSLKRMRQFRPCGEPGPESGLGLLDSQVQYIEDEAFDIPKREKRADTGNNSAGEAGMNMLRLGRLQQSVNNKSGQER